MSENSSLASKMEAQGNFRPAKKSSGVSKVSITKVENSSSIADFMSGKASYADCFEDDSDFNDSDSEDTHHTDGGPGSGNFGHKGVPGQLGGSAPGNGSRIPVDGKDLSGSYKGDGSTKDVIEQQGFGGLPKVMKKKEFDEAVKASKFVAQRTYSASSQEILDAYHDQLMNGDFYVDCTDGGAQYGQGMYCAADYNGELTDGIKSEMEHYIELGESRESMKSNLQKIADQQSEEANRAYRDAIEEGTKDFTDDEKLVFKCNNLFEGTSEENDRAFDIMSEKSREERAAFVKKANAVLDDAQGKMRDITSMSVEEYAEAHNLRIEADPVHRVETLTLDPSAKIVKYSDIQEIYSGEMSSEHFSKVMDDYFEGAVKEMGAEYGEDAETYLKWRKGGSGIKFRDAAAAAERLGDEVTEKLETEYTGISDRAQKAAAQQQTKMRDEAQAIRDKFKNVGAYAAALGYDAINAEGHGESGSYTVVLNRSKTIFLDNDIHEDGVSKSTIYFQMGDDGVMYAIRDGKVIGWVNGFEAPESSAS